MWNFRLCNNVLRFSNHILLAREQKYSILVLSHARYIFLFFYISLDSFISFCYHSKSLTSLEIFTYNISSKNLYNNTLSPKNITLVIIEKKNDSLKHAYRAFKVYISTRLPDCWYWTMRKRIIKLQRFAALRFNPSQ